MGNINVSEIMNENEHKDTVKAAEERLSMVSAWGASAKDASERLFALNKAFEQLSYAVNTTNTSGTSSEWNEAYCELTEAFFKCIREEKTIIIGA